MNRMLTLAMLLAAILGNCTLSAQTRGGKSVNPAKDTLVTDTANDTLAAQKEIDVAAGIAFHRFVFHDDSVRSNLKNTYNKDAFNFKHDAFKEKMKGPWLGDVLRDIFFR